LFDRNVSVSNHVNATSGNIVKTYKESYFKTFSLSSSYADKLLSANSDIIIIQMTLCSEVKVIAELIKKENYDKLFTESNK
jgi:hypothetical protein